jgi:hypothetical protein
MARLNPTIEQTKPENKLIQFGNVRGSVGNVLGKSAQAFQNDTTAVRVSTRGNRRQNIGVIPEYFSRLT